MAERVLDHFNTVYNTKPLGYNIYEIWAPPVPLIQQLIFNCLFFPFFLTEELNKQPAKSAWWVTARGIALQDIME